MKRMIAGNTYFCAHAGISPQAFTRRQMISVSLPSYFTIPFHNSRALRSVATSKKSSDLKRIAARKNSKCNKCPCLGEKADYRFTRGYSSSRHGLGRHCKRIAWVRYIRTSREGQYRNNLPFNMKKISNVVK